MIKMNIKEFKIRCSAIGQIMTEPRTKKDKEAGVLSKTAKSYCDMWIKEQIYHRKHEFNSKQTEKGNTVESESIDFIGDMLGIAFLEKNKNGFENDFMTGTPDAILPELIIDVKNSWDCFTFPLLEDNIPNKDYWWQGQGYMHLTNRKHYKLIYVLSDTPEKLIAKDAYWFAKDNGYDYATTEIYNRFYDKMTYGDIDNKYKIKIFDFDYDNDAIKRVEQRVIKCREYIKERIKTL